MGSSNDVYQLVPVEVRRVGHFACVDGVVGVMDVVCMIVQLETDPELVAHPLHDVQSAGSQHNDVVVCGCVVQLHYDGSWDVLVLHVDGVDGNHQALACVAPTSHNHPRGQNHVTAMVTMRKAVHDLEGYCVGGQGFRRALPVRAARCGNT